MNINEFKESKILFIKGVFIKDCMPMDDIFEQQIEEQLNLDHPVILYTQMPSIFRSLKTWVKKTNVKCWYCDLNFDNIPVFIPKIIEKTYLCDEYNISTYGCFCSFSCAAKFNNLYNQRICVNVDIRDKLVFLFNIFYGRVIKEITPSPDKYIMKQYGGDVDSMLYRKKISDIMTI